MNPALLAVGLLLAAPDTAKDLPHLTREGLGPVRIGMSFPQVEAALGLKLKGEAVEDEESCVEKWNEALPGVAYMFEGGKLTRISIFEESKVTTPEGIGVGSSEARVRAAYPKLADEPHTYLGEKARYLTAWANASQDGGIRFETDDNRKVDIIHAGSGSIHYVEGCL